MPVQRMFDLPSPSELFERARSWFAVAPESTTGDPSSPNTGSTGSAEPASQLPAGSEQTHALFAHSAEVVERPRSLSARLRQGSSMTQANANDNDLPVADALSPREWDQLVDLVVERIEERVSDELSRRGRRFSPGVF